jgi:hypothetical protein
MEQLNQKCQCETLINNNNYNKKTDKDSPYFYVAFCSPGEEPQVYYQCGYCKRYHPEHVIRFDGNKDERWNQKLQWEKNNPMITICRVNQKTEVRRKKEWFFLEVGYILPDEVITEVS